MSESTSGFATLQMQNIHFQHSGKLVTSSTISISKKSISATSIPQTAGSSIFKLNDRISLPCGERCIADFFKVHLDALANDGNFYRRPFKGIPGTPIRYGNQPLGINKLKSFMKVICTKAEWSGYFTNHSCKRMCSTQLYNAGVDEQEIMARTGHRSQAGVRKYKRTSAEISATVSRILDPPCSSSSIEDSAESSVAPQKKLCTDGMEEDITDKRCENSNNGQIFHGCNVYFHA
ncbi:unnamed protein product [Mytilus coruscus]|uniref:Tyr recombinase domain-containing protein n=1 Tax=Mytilus coruscus TaxID=42192 RepID=A0A6J8EAY7_MYTCO|nr:unnamed protein product [Mytilus coruscus]